MENEKGFYVALGVYIGELQKRTDLKNDEICKSVHIWMPSMKRKPGLSGMNGGECIFDTGEEKRRREENGEKTDKVKAAGGKKFPACGLYEWIFL